MPATSFKLHLVRHGEVHNPQGILYGRLPGFRLSARGREQADSVGRYLNGRVVRALFTSPLLRARQTAAMIQRHNPHLKIEVSKLLNEVRGAYEGRPESEVAAQDGDIYTEAAAGCEQPEDIVARAREFLRRLQARYAGGEVAAVTHGDVVTFMVLWAKGVAVIPKSKTRLLEAGFAVVYPAHASITTLTCATHDPDARPRVDYRGL